MLKTCFLPVKKEGKRNAINNVNENNTALLCTSEYSESNTISIQKE